jgi:5-methylcytosine-specific restriction endonuclease McrA
MRRLPIPHIAVGDIYMSVVGVFDEPNLCARLVAARATIVNEEERYNHLARAGQLDQILQSESVNANLSVAEMKELYTKGMTSRNGPARSVYDQLINAGPHGTCPLCGQGKVRTLDHHLPQSKYPSLVITPINLVPACRDCNTAKLNKAPMVPGEQTIHPYFDDFTTARWLHAAVVQNDPPALMYEVCLPEGWPQTVGERLRRHMTVFKLSEAFTLYAAEELSQIAAELRDLHGKGGPAAVQTELHTRALNRERTHRNSWQTAMYYGLAQSLWFHTNGLFLLRPTPTMAVAA